MKNSIRICVFIILVAWFSTELHAQNPSSSTTSNNPPSGLTNPTVVKAVSIFAGGKQVQNIQLTGMVITHYGDDDHGTATLTLNASGDSSLQYLLGNGTRKETTGTNDAATACTWTSADGTPHTVPMHNCLRSIVWFLPAFSLQVASSSPYDIFVSYTPTDSSSSTVGVQHSRDFSHENNPKKPTTETVKQMNDTLQNLSQTKILVDPQTGNITSIEYDIHTDTNQQVNIPVVVRYSDYRAVNGVQIAFKVQKYVNNTLVEDLTVETAIVN